MYVLLYMYIIIVSVCESVYVPPPRIIIMVLSGKNKKYSVCDQMEWWTAAAARTGAWRTDYVGDDDGGRWLENGNGPVEPRQPR